MLCFTLHWLNFPLLTLLSSYECLYFESKLVVLLFTVVDYHYSDISVLCWRQIPRFSRLSMLQNLTKVTLRYSTNSVFQHCSLKQCNKTLVCQLYVVFTTHDEPESGSTQFYMPLWKLWMQRWRPFCLEQTYDHRRPTYFRTLVMLFCILYWCSISIILNHW